MLDDYILYRLVKKEKTAIVFTRRGVFDFFANYASVAGNDCSAGAGGSPVERRSALRSVARALRVAKTPRSSSSARRYNVTTPCASIEYKRDTSCTSCSPRWRAPRAHFGLQSPLRFGTVRLRRGCGWNGLLREGRYLPIARQRNAEASPRTSSRKPIQARKTSGKTNAPVT